MSIRIYTKKILKSLASLKFAVMILLALAVALAAATFLEARYDTAVAQALIYRAPWFYGLLGLLGLNIATVAWSRFPWKKKHIPFLLAHLGIIWVLIGSWITYDLGIDGMLRLEENSVGRKTVLPEDYLWFEHQDGRKYQIHIPWLAPFQTFRPFYSAPSKVWILNYLTHATPELQFTPYSSQGAPAVQLKLIGGPMNANEVFWLWQGAKDWQSSRLGPALFELKPLTAPETKELSLRIEVFQEKNAAWHVRYKAQTSEGKTVTSPQPIPLEEAIGLTLETQWKMGVRVVILNILPEAYPQVHYLPSKIQYGKEAPSSALEIGFGDAQTPPLQGTWLGLGDRISLTDPEGESLYLGYVPKEIVLPFSLRLKEFKMTYDPGTKNPATYASYVDLEDGAHHRSQWIQMNEPLHHKGFTIYQTSYEPASDPQARPTISVFSVNHDPGRMLKYAGSLCIVLGSLGLMLQKTFPNFLTSSPSPSPLSTRRKNHALTIF